MSSFFNLKKLLLPIFIALAVIATLTASYQVKAKQTPVKNSDQNLYWSIYTDGDDIAEGYNNLLKNRLVNDSQFLYFSFDNKDNIASWHRHELYFSMDTRGRTANPLPAGATSLKQLDASYGFRFITNDSMQWVVERYEAQSGSWSSALQSNALTSSVVDTPRQIKGRIPLSELGSPVKGTAIKVKFVSTGEGWATDESPDKAMATYTFQ
ncbi:hypothetical protein [Paraglaciecola marina]|uniref:hypothetical protein n=1 Tax=Paraglaciecola marina TaxID=2500157 RepID=UPI00105E1FDB|nr:hypothetical protein [Paraglaciecola marina]